MREPRALGISPEPLPDGLRLLPPKLPPAPPGLSAPEPSSTPNLKLLAMLLPCFQDAIALGILLQRRNTAGNRLEVNARSARGERADLKASLQNRLELCASRAFLKTHIGEQTLGQLERRISDLTSASENTPSRAWQALRQAALEMGYAPEALATGQISPRLFPAVVSKLAPVDFTAVLFGALAVEVELALETPDPERFERRVVLSLAAITVAALDGAGEEQTR